MATTYQNDEQAQQSWEQEIGPREQGGGQAEATGSTVTLSSCFPPWAGKLGAMALSTLCPAAVIILP